MSRDDKITERQIRVIDTLISNYKCWQVLAGLLVLLLVGCGGGSESDIFSDQSDTGTVTDVGEPFTGRLIGTLNRFDNTLLGVDLDSGQFMILPGNDSFSSTDVSNTDSGIDIRRDPSVPSGAVLTVDDCRSDIAETICFLYVDRDGNVTGQFEINGESPGPGKLSPDGTHLVVNRTDRAGGPSTITIYTRDGIFVSSSSQGGAMRPAGPYDWLPDGRLVYSFEQGLIGDSGRRGFIITQPYSTEPDRTLTFPSEFDDGAIDTIETSPDGTQLLINLEMRIGPRRPILVDTETFSIDELIAFDGGSKDINSIVWGPDGAWTYASLTFRELLSGDALDSSQGGTIVFTGSFDSLFAFAVNGITHPIPESLDDLSGDVVLIPTDSSFLSGGEIAGGNLSGDFIWIP